MDVRTLDVATLNRMVLRCIEELEQERLVDHLFRQSYSLKEGNNASFFLDLISTFLYDVQDTVTDLSRTLYQDIVDFNAMYSLHIKLKGSSACIGARRIRDGCSNLSHAINNQSKEGCLQALRLINDEYKNLHDRLFNIIKIEQELISRAM